MVAERTRLARRLFAPLGPTYDRAGALLSLGQDPRWRRFMVSRVTDSSRVLDVATGTGAVAIELLRRSPTRSVVGIDLSDAMLRAGVERLRAGGLARRSTSVLGQAEHPPFAHGSFDALTFTYLFRYVEDPATTLRGLVELVRPGGTVASLEFGVPSMPWYPGWWLYTRWVMPILGLGVSRTWFDVARFLGPNISAFDRRHPLEAQLAMWRDAGVEPVHVRRMLLGTAVVIWGPRVR